MERNILILLVVACGWKAYAVYGGPSEAASTYHRFATAVETGACVDMERLSDGSARAFVEDLCKPRSITAYGRTLSLPTGANLLQDMSSTPSAAVKRTVRLIESEKRKGDEVELRVTEKVIGRSVENSRDVTHTVKLKLDNTTWKVTEFSLN